MPAKSKSQQRLMGMVHAYKKGELKSSEMPAGLRKKVKKIAGGIKNKSAKEFAKTKHKGLPEKVKEQAKLTFKEYLIEMTQKEREMLTPHPSVVKLYRDIKKQFGIVKRETFLNAAIDRFNLSKGGFERFKSNPAIRAMRFDDDQPQHRGAAPRDGWGHIKNKHQRDRSEASANRELAGNRPLSAEKLDIIRRLGG
jgi:hypothetical protein